MTMTSAIPAPTDKRDAVTEDSIRHVVDAFYAQVRKDARLGPVFDAAIGTDDGHWQHHLERMYRFWSSVMLGSGKYHGNPLQTHTALPVFDAALFDRWMMLFMQTVKAAHTQEIVTAYAERVVRMGENLQRGIFGQAASRARWVEQSLERTACLNGLAQFSMTREFTVESVPAALLSAHRTAKGVWAKINVVQGRVLYTVQDDVSYILSPDRAGVIEPQKPHFVTPVEDAVFYLEFFSDDKAAESGAHHAL